MSVLLAHAVGVWCPRSPEDNFVTGVKDNCLPSLGCWELKSSVRAASDLITIEPFSQLILFRIYQFLKKQNKKRNAR